MRTARPQNLIDALEPRERQSFVGRVWRVVSAGRDPLAGYRSGGRWDDGSFDVLYTSLDRDGAISETVFHLQRGQPIIPSKPPKNLYSIELNLNEVLDLGSIEKLQDLGVNISEFGRMSYAERISEYPSLQEVAEVAHFLAFQAILVPCARWNCRNLVVFTERCSPSSLELSSGGELLDLRTWHRENAARLR